MDRLRAATRALQPDPFGHLRGRERFEAVSSARNALYARFGEEREATPSGPTFDQWLERQAARDSTARAVHGAVQESRERQAAAAARIEADRSGIAAVLGTHPHPDPVDRDPQACGNRYAGRLSEGYRERAAVVQRAQAEALAALAGRSVGTRILSLFGIVTPEQRSTAAAVERALSLTESAEQQQPTPRDYAEARSDGADHAHAAQRETAAWEQRPDVARALEQARLNTAVDAAVEEGDPTVSRAMRAGDSEAAREVIREREEAERRRIEEQERRLGQQRGPGGPAAPGAGGPKPKGMR